MLKGAGSQILEVFMKTNDKKFTEVFGFGKLADIASEILDRASDDDREDIDASEKVIDALNDSLIYYNDQWEVIKAYQNPTEANFQNALDDFLNDLLSVIEE